MSVMTVDDHRAAACEVATVHRCVDEFEHDHSKTFEVGLHLEPPATKTGGRVRRNLQRIRKALDRIRFELQAVQACTLPDGERPEYGCKPAETLAPAGARRHPTEVVTLDDHIAAARALGPAEPAMDRFLDIIKRRRHLPVRIMDDAIRVLHLIQIVRLEMSDLQLYMLSGRGIPHVNCWQGQSNHFDGTEQSGVHQ
jgi:hypothetical protein